MVGKFEQTLARFVGARFAVSFSSGTAALQAAYFAARVGAGDEVITTPLTFAATAYTAIWQGARPVFADIDPATGNIDPKEVEKNITKRTRAIAAVDYAGLPVRLDALRRIARKHKLVLLEDAAHALGATYKGKRVGGIADMTMFSFHPVKSITTGEGGVITTNSRELYERLQLFRNHGITKDEKRYVSKSPGAWYHEMQELGLNYRITDIQAALGVSQLKQLPGFLKERRSRTRIYQNTLSKNIHILLPHESKEGRSAWHLYVIRLRGALTGKRAEVFKKLHKAGIGVQVHYIPVYWHPYFQKQGYKKGLCPKAETFYESCFSIPLFPTLSKKDQDYVIRQLQTITENA